MKELIVLICNKWNKQKLLHLAEYEYQKANICRVFAPLSLT